MKIIIKQYNKQSEDIKQAAVLIADLADTIWHEHYTPIIGEAQVGYMLSRFQSAEQIYDDIVNNGFTYFSGYEGEPADKNTPIGYAACRKTDDYLFLSKMYVHKDYRGKGLSRLFLDEMIILAKSEYNCDKIRLTVNKHNDGSIAVYKAMGFEIIDSIVSDIGVGYVMDDFLMEKRIR